MNLAGFKNTSGIILGKISLLTCSVLFLYGCNSGIHKKKIFRYNDTNSLASLDPAFAKNQTVMWPIHQLYNTLVAVNDSLQIVPSLARSWQVSADGLVYTFILRSDVFFHNDACFPNSRGRRLLAYDVVFSFLRVIDPKVASPGAWIFNNKVDTAAPFVALNDTVFQLKLLKPYSPVLGVLTMQYCSIVPKEAVVFYGSDFRKHPVGTGPFQLVTWVEGQALVLKKNSQYFERDSMGSRLPYIDGVKVSFYESKATEFLLFRQKKIDFINDIDASFKDELLTKNGALRSKWANKLKLQKSPYLNVEYLGILVDTNNVIVKNNPLKHLKIRRAVNYAINRKKMMLYLRNSIGKPALNGFIPPGLPAYDSAAVKGFEYNPALARQLVNEVGLGNQNIRPEIKLYTIPIYADLANYIAKQINEIGIAVSIEVVQKSFLIEMATNSRANMFRASWIADYPDAENYLQVFYSQNPAPPNYTRFQNKEFDMLFDKALLETDPDKKNSLYKQADKLIISQAPVVPLWYDEAIHFSQSNITGFKPNPLNMLELRRVKIE